MKRIFVETRAFTKKIEKLKDPMLLQVIQEQLLKFPDVGDVIPGLGGLRKARIQDSAHGKGKRGGYRLIYLDLPHAGRTYLLWIYGKRESEDISPAEKKVLSQQVELLKKEVIR